MSIRLNSYLTGAALALLTVGPALSADLPRRSLPATSVYAVPPAFTWTGFYLGVNAGGAFSTRDDKKDEAVLVPGLGLIRSAHRDKKDAGFVGGAQVGYNLQFSPGQGFVAGIEADLQYVAGEKKRDRTVNGFISRDKDDNGYFGTVRGRFGYAFDRLLVYATTGLAIGDLGSGEGRALILPAGVTLLPRKDDDKTKIGFVAGLGAEYAVTDNISLRLEGLYVDLSEDKKKGDVIVVPGGVPVVLDRKKDDEGMAIVRAGLNYRF